MAAHRQRTRRRKKKRSGNGVLLLACVVLFVATFFGNELLSTLHRAAQADFSSAFSDLGESLSAREPLGKSVEDFAVAVFGVAPIELTPEPVQLEPEDETLVAELLPEQIPVASEPPEIIEPSAQVEVVEPTLPPEPSPVYTGKELPARTSMEQPELAIETVMPVMGVLTSDFGWRTDPINGADSFHYGTDLAVEEGTDIHAFSSGTVEYIGESESLGLYMKIAHANNVSSLYAHCSELLYDKGAEIEIGQVVARSGNTGRSTGPHLHFEIRIGDTWYNPAYYLELE